MIKMFIGQILRVSLVRSIFKRRACANAGCTLNPNRVNSAPVALSFKKVLRVISIIPSSVNSPCS